MEPKRKVTDLKENEGILITSKKEAKKITWLLKEEGILLNDAPRAWYYKTYKTDTVFYGNARFDSRQTAERNGHILYPASDFLTTDTVEELDTLPKYWVVENDGSQEFKDTVIKYLNETYKQDFKLGNFKFYGFDENRGQCHEYLSAFQNNPVLLTIPQFKKCLENMKQKEQYSLDSLTNVLVEPVEEKVFTFPRLMLVWGLNEKNVFVREVLLYEARLKRPYLALNGDQVDPYTEYWENARELPESTELTIEAATIRLNEGAKPEPGQTFKIVD